MHQDVDVLPEEDQRVVLSEDFEFDLPCDSPRVWPERFPEHSDPAKWIGLKACGHHRLFCQRCKDIYLDEIAVDTHFSCAECGNRGQTFLGFELIGKARL